MAEGWSPVKRVATGFLLALVHALSAVVLVGVLFYLTSGPIFTTTDLMGRRMMAFTWFLILGLGVWTVVSGFRGNGDPQRDGRSAKLGTLVLSGAVPCPGAAAIMILAASENEFILGTASVAAMSLGMGTLLAVTGGLTALFRDRLKNTLLNRSGGAGFEKWVHLLSGSFMVLLAAFMLAGEAVR